MSMFTVCTLHNVQCTSDTRYNFYIQSNFNDCALERIPTIKFAVAAVFFSVNFVFTSPKRARARSRSFQIHQVHWHMILSNFQFSIFEIFRLIFAASFFHLVIFHHHHQYGYVVGRSDFHSIHVDFDKISNFTEHLTDSTSQNQQATADCWHPHVIFLWSIKMMRGHKNEREKEVRLWQRTHSLGECHDVFTNGPARFENQFAIMIWMEFHFGPSQMLSCEKCDSTGMSRVTPCPPTAEMC